MKNALISPNEQVKYIASWIPNTDPLEPVWEILPNAYRIAEISNTVFDVSEPLFWEECQDDVKSDQWYYDSITKEIKEIPCAPLP